MGCKQVDRTIGNSLLKMHRSFGMGTPNYLAVPRAGQKMTPGKVLVHPANIPMPKGTQSLVKAEGLGFRERTSHIQTINSTQAEDWSPTKKDKEIAMVAT